jgi:hypothetical protein
MEVEVVFSCLRKIEHLSALRGFPEYDIRDAFAWAVGSMRFLKDFAHIFIAARSQQRTHADSSIEPQIYEWSSGTRHARICQPDVFGLPCWCIAVGRFGPNPIRNPFSLYARVPSFIADTTGRPQNTVNWAVPQDLTLGVHGSNVSYKKYAASPKGQLAIQFEPSCLPDSSALLPTHSSSHAPSTKQEHLTRGSFSRSSYQSSNSQPTQRNHPAILKELFWVGAD